MLFEIENKMNDKHRIYNNTTMRFKLTVMEFCWNLLNLDHTILEDKDRPTLEYPRSLPYRPGGPEVTCLAVMCKALGSTST